LAFAQNCLQACTCTFIRPIVTWLFVSSAEQRAAPVEASSTNRTGPYGLPRDCMDWKHQHSPNCSGVYTIHVVVNTSQVPTPCSDKKLEVWCDWETDNGDWLVRILRLYQNYYTLRLTVRKQNAKCFPRHKAYRPRLGRF